MAPTSKRKRMDNRPQDTTAPLSAPQHTYTVDQPRLRKRNRKGAYSSDKARPHKYAVHRIKSRIRDIERRLRNDRGLFSDVRVAYERELAALKHDLLKATAGKQKQEMIKQDHMVRFFERQKATRALKRAKKELNSAAVSDANNANEPTLTREEKIRLAEIDLNYTKFYPLAQKYVSMWPKTNETADGPEEARRDRVGPKGNVEMWKRIERATEEGPQALERLKNEIPKATVHRDTIANTSSHGLATLESKPLETEREHDDPENRSDADSDGGFFE